MKVLLVNGSPNKLGCTYTALSEVAGALNREDIETEIMWLGVKPLAGCIGCGKCRETGRCFRDDIVNEFAQKSFDADGFVFGTPVHFASATGAITSFMDRTFIVPTGLRHKPAAAICSCRRGGAASTFDQLNKYFTIRCMPIVSSNYWNMVHGSTPDDVKQDIEGLQTMRVLGKNMAWLLKCIEAGKQAGIVPQDEDKVYTNFIR